MTGGVTEQPGRGARRQADEEVRMEEQEGSAAERERPLAENPIVHC